MFFKRKWLLIQSEDSYSTPRVGCYIYNGTPFKLPMGTYVYESKVIRSGVTSYVYDTVFVDQTGVSTANIEY